MQIIWKFTADGLLAFVGGTFALIGVWLSNRQSIKNLQSQRDAEKSARAEEVRRQRLAIASAPVAEIEDFRGNHVEAVGSKRNEGMSVKILDRRFYVY